MSLGSFLDLAVLDTSISVAASKWPSQHIPATSPLLVPGIIAHAFVPWSHPALLAEACYVEACVDLFSAPQPCPLSQRLVWASLRPLSSLSVSQGLCALVSAPWALSLCCGAYVHLFHLTGQLQGLCVLLAPRLAPCTTRVYFLFYSFCCSGK